MTVAIIAEHAHPLVKFICHRMNTDELKWQEVADKSGIAKSTIRSWASAEGAIMLQNIEAVLGALDYALKPVLIGSTHYGSRAAFGPGTHRMRCGQFATVQRVADDGSLFGSYFNGRIECHWNGAGRRMPLGGTDPSDLVP